jgi:putative tricarboxylic transport membrane protein
VTGYILLITGLVAALSSIQLSLGKFSRPGPGFLPFVLSLLLICLSLALILQQWNKGSSSAPFWPQRTWVRPLLGVIVFVLYAWLIEHLGFLAVTFLFMVFWMWMIEKIGWLRILLVSGSVTAVLYSIFAYFLEVPLPSGIFG